MDDVVPVHVRGELRLFAYYLANGSVFVDEFGDLGDYRAGLWEYASTLEKVFAIYMNVLRFGPDGVPANAERAMRRAAQYIRADQDSTYEVTPPFASWEVELH